MVVQEKERAQAMPWSRGGARNAHSLLYGPIDELSSAPEGVSRFAYDHDTTEFDRLVETKYAETPRVAAAYANSVAGYQGYARTEAPTSRPYSSDNYNNNSYQYSAETEVESAPVSNLKSYSVDHSDYSAPSEPQQKYFNDTNPIPTQEYQTFRPRIFDFEAHGYDNANTASMAQPSAGVYTDAPAGDFGNLEQIAEVEVVAEQQSFAPEPRVTEQTFFEPHLRLNAKGLIAVATFFAVVAMVTILIIVNSIAIGNNGSRISTLQAQNTALAAEYAKVAKARDDAYNAGVKYAEQNMVGDGNAYGFEKIDTTPLS